MNSKSPYEGGYSERQVNAAHRVLVDIGQVLAAFHDAVVVIGGWVPDLLFPLAEPKHIGSIDVDLALDAAKLNDGRYAELLGLLLGTGRYQMGEKVFQLVTEVPLDDEEYPVRVDVELVAPSDVKMQKNHPKLVDGFRVLQFPACAAAFRQPVDTNITGQMTSGAMNSVRLRVASLSDFIVMKSHAIGRRDKPKDVYDLCYSLDIFPGGIAALSEDWGSRRDDPLVNEALRILREKFKTVAHYGPAQLVMFHDPQDPDQDALHARRAYELVQKLLDLA